MLAGAKNLSLQSCVREFSSNLSVPHNSCTFIKITISKDKPRVIMKDELAAGGQYHLTPMGDAMQKTTVTPLKIQMNTNKSICVATLSKEGFRLTDNTFLWGPVALFPKVALSWRVLTQDHITEESLEFFTILEPKLDIVVVGVGGREFVDPVRKRIFPLFSRMKIGLEVLPTYDAITTFNWLNADGRYVGAALFPPKKGFIHQFFFVQMGYLEAMNTMFAFQTPDILDEDFWGWNSMVEYPKTKSEMRKELESEELERETVKKLKDEERKKLE